MGAVTALCLDLGAVTTLCLELGAVTALLCLELGAVLAQWEGRDYTEGLHPLCGSAS